MANWVPIQPLIQRSKRRLPHNSVAYYQVVEWYCHDFLITCVQIHPLFVRLGFVALYTTVLYELLHDACDGFCEPKSTSFASYTNRTQHKRRWLE